MRVSSSPSSSSIRAECRIFLPFASTLSSSFKPSMAIETMTTKRETDGSNSKHPFLQETGLRVDTSTVRTSVESHGANANQVLR